MGKHIVVVGFGPGISTGVAERFGAEGFAVSLVARNQERLAAGVAALEAKGIKATAIAADASNVSAIRAAIAKARTTLGPVTAIHWNAYGGGGDLLTADAERSSRRLRCGDRRPPRRRAGSSARPQEREGRCRPDHERRLR